MLQSLTFAKVAAHFGTLGVHWATPIPLPNETLIVGLGYGEKRPFWDEKAERFIPRLLRAEGTALDMVGQAREAQVVYRQALRLAPIDPNLHGNLALSLALTGDRADALNEMQAAVASPTPDPRQETNAILVLALTGNATAAEARGDTTSTRRPRARAASVVMGPMLARRHRASHSFARDPRQSTKFSTVLPEVRTTASTRPPSSSRTRSAKACGSGGRVSYATTRSTA